MADETKAASELVVPGSTKPDSRDDANPSSPHQTTPAALTPAEFAERMREIAKAAEADEEIAHGRADSLMCALLRSLGYGEGVAIFEGMPKWYA